MSLYLLLFLNNLVQTIGIRYQERLFEEYETPSSRVEYFENFRKIQKRQESNATPIRNRIVEAMLKTPAYQFIRSEPNFLSAFKDHYEIRKGT